MCSRAGAGTRFIQIWESLAWARGFGRLSVRAVDPEEGIGRMLGGGRDFLGVGCLGSAKQLSLKQVLKHQSLEMHRRKPGIGAPELAIRHHRLEYISDPVPSDDT